MFNAYRGQRASTFIPKTPRPYKNENARDKHDFCDFYISAIIKRRRWLHANHILPKKVGSVNRGRFFVGAIFPRY